MSERALRVGGAPTRDSRNQKLGRECLYGFVNESSKVRLVGLVRDAGHCIADGPNGRYARSGLHGFLPDKASSASSASRSSMASTASFRSKRNMN